MVTHKNYNFFPRLVIHFRVIYLIKERFTTIQTLHHIFLFGQPVCLANAIILKLTASWRTRIKVIYFICWQSFTIASRRLQMLTVMEVSVFYISLTFIKVLICPTNCNVWCTIFTADCNDWNNLILEAVCCVCLFDWTFILMLTGLIVVHYPNK